MSDRDEQLGARIAALEAAQHVSEVEAASLERALHAPPHPSGGGAGLNAEALARQDAQRLARVQLHEKWQASYDEQLAKVAPKIERLTAQQRALEAERVELRRRQTVEMVKLEAAIGKVRREIDELATPPEAPADPPSPDQVESVLVDAGGSWGPQLIPRAVYDAQTQRRQSGKRR
jgi:hypothetical protein